jgi:hypothetical protein
MRFTSIKKIRCNVVTLSRSVQKSYTQRKMRQLAVVLWPDCNPDMENFIAHRPDYNPDKFLLREGENPDIGFPI